MNAPYQKHLELSLVHFMAFPEALEGKAFLETLEQVALDPFFTAVEVGPIPDAELRRAAARLLEQAHLKVAFGAQPLILERRLNPNAPEPKERERALEALKQAADQALELGARRLALLSGPNPPPHEREERIKLLIDSLHRLSAYAERQGLEGLTLETFDYDIDKRALIGSNRDGARVAAALRSDHPGFGLLVDLSHLPLQHESIAEALEAAGPYLVHAHIGNCVLHPGHPAHGDRHPRFGLPGGTNDVPQVKVFIEKLFAIGFFETRRWLGFEVRPQPGESSSIVIANAKRVFLEAWAQAEPPQPIELGGA